MMAIVFVRSARPTFKYKSTTQNNDFDNDYLTYHLYCLTEEEIKIVDGKE